MTGHTEPTELTLARARQRRGIKWSKHGEAVLPLWVADMDFDPAKEVLDAMRDVIDRGDLGYNPSRRRAMAHAWCDWQEREHGWTPDVDRTRPFTSVLHALMWMLELRTDPGDGIVVFTPIYHPFLSAIRNTDRRIDDVPLSGENWRLDPALLNSVIDDRTTVILMCQPHNPAGRVFDGEELRAVAEAAERHDLQVWSDEIWADLAFDAPHQPLATADERLPDRLTTFSSASKAFNLAGTRCAVMHTGDAAVHDAFEALPPHQLGVPSTVSVAAATAAWQLGGPWLQRARTEIIARRDELFTRLAVECPQIGHHCPQATYLAWLDFTDTWLFEDPAAQLLEHGALALNDGAVFGEQGRGRARLNFATSTDILNEGLDRLIRTVNAGGPT